MRKETAIKMCQEWHGGQWSALYQFASSGQFVHENALRYVSEVQKDIERPEYALRTFSRAKSTTDKLIRMRDFFIKLASKNNVPIILEKHPNYGYLMPLVAFGHKLSEVELEKITPIRYLI
jgi:hypothetical protein